MDIPTGERRQGFSEWLRAGRTLRNGVEFKFNPYHDPANGKFTTAGGGWMGGGFTGGGGGSFGGGGATGSWGATEKRPKARAPVQGNTPTLRPAVPRTPGAIATAPVAQRLLQPAPDLRRVVRNRYEYRIDLEDRTTSVSGTLTLNGSQLRSGRTQAQPAARIGDRKQMTAATISRRASTVRPTPSIISPRMRTSIVVATASLRIGGRRRPRAGRRCRCR